MKTLVKDIAIIPMTRDYVIPQGYIVIKDQIIEAIGEGEAPSDNYQQVIEGNNQVALPGFINTHTHAAMTLLRGYADDLPLMQWLEKKIWPLEAKLTGDDIYWGTLLAIVEMIKSGTTTFVDMYFHMERVAQAVQESGIRAILSRGMIGVGPESEQALEQSRQMVEHWHNQARGRIIIMLGPHAPYTCPPEYLQRVMELAEECGIGINIHVAETADEYENILKQYGKTPVAHLDSLGLFDHFRVIAAHCVHLSEEDIAILKAKGVGIAHNPESNMKLASGIAPVPLLLQEGVDVGLGTDGASSNNNLNMIGEMRSCALLHKVSTMDPTVLPAYQALSMATRYGSKVIGLENEIGTLEKGKKADIILMNLGAAHMVPRYDIMANIVYASEASDVNTVIIDGELVMQDRQLLTLNEAEILNRCKEIAARLVG
ncbi:amidohydrolase [Syntrophomonas erecta]